MFFGIFGQRLGNGRPATRYRSAVLRNAGQGDLNSGIDPVEQIFPEFISLPGFGVAIGGTDNPDVHVNGMVVPPLLLDGLQKG